MPQFLAPLINDQQEDVNGNPLSGGKIEVYLAGSSTPATTYNDRDGLAPHANTWPIVLNTLGVNGQGAVWLVGGQSYKFIIKDSAGAVQRTIDYVSGINDSTASIDQWVAFAGVPTFVSATSFTVPGDQTQTFQFGTRLKTVNTGGVVYSTVVRSVFAATTTTVTVVNDSGALDSGLSSISVGLIGPVNPSLPGTLTTPPFRNRLINGLLRNDQRNGGSAQAITFGGTIAYTTDRFYVSCTGANITSQRVAGTGYQFAQTLTGAASVTGTLWGQRIASRNCWDWVGKQVNVQVPISAVGIASATWNAYVANAQDDFSAKTLLATGTLSLTGVVETKFFSFAAGANASRGVAIEIVTGALVAGQSITYQGAVQAEAGQVSPFEYVDETTDLVRCMRYYQTSYQGVPPATPVATAGRIVDLSSSTSAYGILRVYLSPPMRVAPATVIYNPTTGGQTIRNETTGVDYTIANVGGSAVSPNYFAYQTAIAPPASVVLSMHYTASAEL